MEQILRRATRRLRHDPGKLGRFKHDAQDGRSGDRPGGAIESRQGQLLLLSRYRAIAAGQSSPFSFSEVEFRTFSQNGEDGILLYLFGLLGMGKCRCVEICAGNGVDNNTANLVVNHGWNGLMFEGNPILADRARSFYSQSADTRSYSPRIVNTWITRKNMNDLLRQHGFEGEVDLLSLDINGIDYWLWEAIDAIEPRVVVAEIQCIWGLDRSVTVPYAADFRCGFIDGFGVYCGASLPAFVKLARRKGYCLVGAQRLGFNVLFVKNGVCEDLLPEVDAQECADMNFVSWGRQALLPKVQDRPWVEV